MNHDPINKLIDRIAPCLLNNPKDKIRDGTDDPLDFETSLCLFVGERIAFHKNDSAALKKIKDDLTSAIIAFNNIIQSA